jgi:hypothetical protein
VKDRILRGAIILGVIIEFSRPENPACRLNELTYRNDTPAVFDFKQELNIAGRPSALVSGMAISLKTVQAIAVRRRAQAALPDHRLFGTATLID